jgi:PAS domain S-box-containing protein
MGVFRDISERKRLERQQQEAAGRMQQQLEALQAERERMDLVLGSTSAVVYSARIPDFQIEFVSESIKAVLGYTPAENREPGHWESIVHPDDQSRVLSELSSFYEKGHHVHEYRLLHKAGHWIWVRDELRLIRDSQGTPLRAVGASIDITSRKRNEVILQTVLALRELVATQMQQFLVGRIRNPEEMFDRILPQLGGLLGVSSLEVVDLGTAVPARRHRWGRLRPETNEYLQMLLEEKSVHLLSLGQPVILRPLENGGQVVVVPFHRTHAQESVLILENPRLEPVTVEEVAQMLGPVAESYAAARKRYEIGTQLQALNQQLAATNRLNRSILELSTRVAACRTRDDLNDLLQNHVLRLTNVNRVTMIEVDDSASGYQICVFGDAKQRQPIDINSQGTAFEKAIQTGQPVGSSRYGAHDFRDWNRFSEMGLSHFLCCPLVTPHGILGTLNFAWDAPISAEDETLYVQFSLIVTAQLLVYQTFGHLTRLNEELEVRVERRTQDLQQVHQQVQMQAEKALREKEMMLKEIHHRVKNNLQIISSLLSMQGRSNQGDPRELLKTSALRIRSMSLIHEQLYQSAHLSQIDLGAYIGQLSHHLSYSLHPDAGMQIQVEAEEVWMGVDTAVPCGLIMNELIVNALKHAVSTEKPCEIKVVIRKEGSECLLSVSDNGPGLPPDYLWRRSFGVQLVMTLVQQLRGKIATEAKDCVDGCHAIVHPGACVCIRLPL